MVIILVNISSVKICSVNVGGLFMFVGREKEIERINRFISKRGALIVYGLRRVGKTTLIKKALGDKKIKFVYFECQKANEKTNVDLFVDLLKESISFTDASFPSFLALFKELNQRYKDYVFVIDEYSYMKEYYLESKKSKSKLEAQRIDSEFQNIIDDYLTNNNLILSGSSIYIMEKLMDHESPLYGRFVGSIVLKQFTYLEAKMMLPSLTDNDLIAFYSVFGGSPYVLERINQQKNLKDNICELLLNEDGKLRNHLKNNVINELESDPDLHEILNVIKNGCKKYNEIENQSHITTSGLLDKRLKKLLDLDIIEAKYLIGREDDKRKKYYEIKDNLLKFYYAYVFRQDNKMNFLGEERFYELFIEPSIKTYISHRFESIVKSYFSESIKRGYNRDIVEVGTFFFDNNEYDCVAKKIDGTYVFFEVKYYSKPMKRDEMEKEMEQLKNVKGLKVSQIGFVCNAGFEEKLPNVIYLDLADFFFKS